MIQDEDARGNHDMKISMFKKFAVILIVLLLAVGSQAVPLGGTFDTKTKIRIEKHGIWVESEISPQALLAALPAIDQNADHRLDEAELSDNSEAILNYYASYVKLESEARPLTADSTYFAFRSPASPDAVPDRYFIYHWYAVLRHPGRLKISNQLFSELPSAQAARHHGALISRENVLNFKFPSIAEDENPIAAAYAAVLFEISSDGRAKLVSPDNKVAQAGYVWVGVGLGGLLLLRLASAARARWGRKEQLEVVEDEEEEMEESPVYS